MGGKFLFLVPAETARGGITNYYHVLRSEFPDEVEYFIRGSRTWPQRKGLLNELIRAYLDYKRFKRRLSQNDIKLIQTSTSLGIATTIRDGLFIRYAHKKGVKTIVFFRGWDEKTWDKIKRRIRFFRFFLFSSDKILTLSENVKNHLINCGYSKEIILETTTFDKNLSINISECFIKDKFREIDTKKEINLLYISRIERKKGIYDLVDAFEILYNKSIFFKLSLTICGDGFELDQIKKYIDIRKLDNVQVKGFVYGDIKQLVFKTAHIFILPSQTEGMPNAVLEAMGAGIPVISTRVGGIIDFFVDGINGFFIEFDNPYDIVAKIEQMTADKEILTNMALVNYKTANQRFRSDIVAKRILSICDATIEK